MEAYLASIPDEQESGSQELILNRGPRGERMDEEFDLGCVVLVRDHPRHDSGLVVDDDILNEPCNRQSAQLGAEGKRHALQERADCLRRRGDGENRTVGHLPVARWTRATL